jgi:hypothetical protein
MAIQLTIRIVEETLHKLQISTTIADRRMHRKVEVENQLEKKL